MKKAYEKRQYLILLHQLLVIVFLCYAYKQNYIVGLENFIPLTILSFLIVDASYISFINLKGNKILSKFSNLLLLVSWQFLFSLNENNALFTMSTFLSVVILYKAVQFLCIFFFQDTNYTYKKSTDGILALVSLLTLLSLLINEKLFALFFLLQWIVSFSCMIFLFLKHRKRILFVLWCEKKQFLKTGLIIFISFIIYVIVFADKPTYLSNFGWYIIVIFPLFSIHSIAFKNKEIRGNDLPIKKTNFIVMSLIVLLNVMMLGLLFQLNVISYFIILHTVVWMVFIRLTLLYKDLQSTLLEKESSQMAVENFYAHNLVQIMKEEELKRDVSNYLHDEILQDILSIKNIMMKADREDVRQIIFKTLENLNHSIREQMQEFHPTLLKTLTLKDNYTYLLTSLKQKYGDDAVEIVFNCEKDVFLVEPYHLLVYRMLKELVTNALKHAQCTHIIVTLKQEDKNIELIVADNGKGFKKNAFEAYSSNHKGLSSIQEQLCLLNGRMMISENFSTGFQVYIQIPMKGDESYQHFINR